MLSSALAAVKMKMAASSAMENGLTSQLMPSVVAMPRQCLPTYVQGGEVNFQQHGDDHEPHEQGNWNVDMRQRGGAEELEQAGEQLAEDDARDDAERHPEREVALEKSHGL